MKKQSYQILKYLQENGDSTAIQVGEVLNIEKRRVDSCFTAAIMNAGLGIRDQSVSPSMLRLTEEGRAYHQDEDDD